MSTVFYECYKKIRSIQNRIRISRIYLRKIKRYTNENYECLKNMFEDEYKYLKKILKYLGNLVFH